MTTKIVKNYSLASAIGALLICVAPTANAVLLGPGMSSGKDFPFVQNFPTDFVPGPITAPGVVLASQTSLFTGQDAFFNVLFTADINQVVVREASGFLTFYYQVQSLTGNPIGRFTANGFAAYTTDVFVEQFNIGAGDVLFNLGVNNATFKAPPATVVGGDSGLYFNQDRSFSGETIGYTFNKTGALVNQLDPPDSTYWLGVRTNATQYSLSSGALIDGAVATRPIYAPAVPEPSTAIFGIAMVASLLGGRLNRRNSMPLAD